MQRVVVAIAHAMTWFWTQTCLAALKRSLAAGAADGYDVEIIVVDNSWDNSPSIRGVTDTRLGEGVRIIKNDQVSFCHSAALDIAFAAAWPMDYFISLDSDCVILRPDWLRQFLDNLCPTDYAIGALHSEGGVCCSFALYRGEVVKMMADASAANPDRHFRWGDGFALSVPIPEGHERLLSGPFSDRRGWQPGTVLKEAPINQTRGPGHYEPGQQLHYGSVQAGHTYSLCSAKTFRDDQRGIPLGTFYGVDPASGLNYDQSIHSAWAVHFWAGTRALDMVNSRGGDLTDRAIVNNMGFWLEREAGWWVANVPDDVRAETVRLIGKYGWHLGPLRPDARPDSITRIKAWYRAGGVDLG